MSVRLIVKVMMADKVNNSPRGRLMFSAIMERISIELATMREVGTE